MSSEKIGINQYLKENIIKVAKNEGRFYISPNIDKKKLSAAIKAFDFKGDEASIITIVDTSMFGSGKAGLIFTGERMIFNEALEKPWSISYESIKTVQYEEVKKENKKGKVSFEPRMAIFTKDGGKRVIKNTIEIDLKKLTDILSVIPEEYDEFVEQSQLQPLSEMDDALKKAYIKVIINMALHGDGVVDDNEFTEILQLMSRLDLDSKSRMELRYYIVDESLRVANEGLIEVINRHAPDGMLYSLHVSLIKDLISVHSSVIGQIDDGFDFLIQIRSLLEIGDDEISLAVEAIKNDKKILDRRYTDNAIQKSVKELSAKAVAVGVPLGAVYMSGSVVGLSAAGMTSGLASLGFGGMLGLSSMATGIGAAIVLGVVAYKGVRHITNTGIEEGDKRREYMLQEVIRQSQKTMQIIIADINELVSQLNEGFKQQELQGEKIQELKGKLMHMLELMGQAGTKISDKTRRAEADKQRLRSPEILDVLRLEACTRSPDHAAYREFILQFYKEESILEVADDGSEIKKDILRLSKSGTEEEMQRLGEVFETIGYHKASSALKGKWREVVDGK